MIKNDNTNGEWCEGTCKPFTKKATTFFKCPPEIPIPVCDKCEVFAENLVLKLKDDPILTKKLKEKVDKAKGLIS